MGSKILVEPAAFIFFRVEDATSSFLKNEFYIFHSMHYDTIVTLQISQMHTLHYNYNNVLIRQLTHVSGFTGPSSGSRHLHKTII